MAAPFKLCPRCQLQAPLTETLCSRCGHQYRTAFTPPIPLEQTQAVYPQAPTPSGMDLTRSMDVRPIPSVYVPPRDLPPQQQQYPQSYAGLSSPYGPLRNPYGQAYAQPVVNLDPPKNHTAPIILMWSCLGIEFAARFIFPGMGAGAISVLAWFGSLGLAIFLVTQEEKVAKVNGWVVIGIKAAQIVLVVVIFIFVMSVVSRSIGAIGSGRPGSPPYGARGMGSTSTSSQPWPSVNR